MWCIPGELDDQYIERMERLLDLYAEPEKPEEPLVCLDEKTTLLRDDKRPPRPGKPGSIKKRDYEYKRNGSGNVFMAVAPKLGQRQTFVRQRRTGKDFAEVLREVANAYPGARKIHLVMDNLNTHFKKSLITHLGEEEADSIWSRFELYYTPKHASWLNMAELEISVLSRQAIGKGRIPSVEALEERVRPWTEARNLSSAKIKWGFTSAKAREIFRYEREKVI